MPKLCVLLYFVLGGYRCIWSISFRITSLVLTESGDMNQNIYGAH